MLHLFDNRAKINRLLGTERRTRRNIIERIVGANTLGVQRAVKAAAQLAHKGERTAEVDDLSLDLASLRQSGNGLADHRVKNALRNIALARALVEQGLNVGFGKHAAARGDGVGLFVLLGELVQLLERNVEQRRHLVDKRAGAACAGAVHAHLQTAAQKQDLRILAAQLDHHVGARNKGVCRHPGRKDLLHELNAAVLRHAHAGGAGKRQGSVLDAGDLAAHAVEDLGDFFGDL